MFFHDNILRLDWEDYIHAVYACLVNNFDGYTSNDGSVIEGAQYPKPDVIFGPMRGGLLFALIASHRFNVKMYALDPDNLENTQQPFTPIQIHQIKLQRRGKKPIALLVDDISDSGKTFKKCKRYLCEQGYKVITCAIVVKADTKYIPDISAYNTQKENYVIFPYEVYANEIKNIKKDSKDKE